MKGGAGVREAGCRVGFGCDVLVAVWGRTEVGWVKGGVAGPWGWVDGGVRVWCVGETQGRELRGLATSGGRVWAGSGKGGVLCL